MKSIYFEVNIPKILLTKLFARVLPSVYYSSISPVRFGDIPKRELPGPRWVRVKNIMTGICGVDAAMFFVAASPKISIAALPGIPRAYMGHEVLGRVIETGPSVGTVAPGDRVILQRYLPCCSIKEIVPPCAPCRDGNYTLCENFSSGQMPENLGAGFGEALIAHESQLMKVPDDLRDEQAVMIEPTAVSLHAVLRRPPRKGEKVLVIGAGTIGLGVIQAAKVVNPEAFLCVMEKIPFKRDLAKRLGGDEILTGDPYEDAAKATGGKLYRGALGNHIMLGGFDLIYDCVGYSRTIHDSLRWLKARGDYVMIGNQLSPASFDQTPVWNQELTMRGINAHGMEEYDGRSISSFALAMELVQSGKIQLDGLVTHRFPLSAYREAFRLMNTKSQEVIKAVFVMGSE